MKKIVNGYYQFFDHYFQKQKFYQDLFDQQKPIAMFISCCDSRVDPALLVSARPGDIFVERNVANIVPHVEDGANSILIALQVALSVFQIKDIIVLGHQQCAGVKMLATGQLQLFHPAPIEYKNREAKLLLCELGVYDQNNSADYEKLNLTISCQNLLTHPIIKDQLRSRKVTVHGWYFSLKTGKIKSLCWSCLQFTDLMVECCGKKIM